MAQVNDAPPPPPDTGNVYPKPSKKDIKSMDERKKKAIVQSPDPQQDVTMAQVNDAPPPPPKSGNVYPKPSEKDILSMNKRKKKAIRLKKREANKLRKKKRANKNETHASTHASHAADSSEAIVPSLSSDEIRWPPKKSKAYRPIDQNRLTPNGKREAKAQKAKDQEAEKAQEAKAHELTLNAQSASEPNSSTSSNTNTTVHATTSATSASSVHAPTSTIKTKKSFVLRLCTSNMCKHRYWQRDINACRNIHVALAYIMTQTNETEKRPNYMSRKRKNQSTQVPTSSATPVLHV